MRDLPDSGNPVDVLEKRITTLNDPLRMDLAGQMIEALIALSDEAADAAGTAASLSLSGSHSTIEKFTLVWKGSGL